MDMLHLVRRYSVFVACNASDWKDGEESQWIITCLSILQQQLLANWDETLSHFSLLDSLSDSPAPENFSVISIIATTTANTVIQQHMDNDADTSLVP